MHSEDDTAPYRVFLSSPTAVAHLGIEVDDAIEIAEKIDI